MENGDFYAFFLCDREIEGVSFAAKGGEAELFSLPGVYMEWLGEYGGQLPQIRMGAADVIYLAGQGEKDGRTMIAVWACAENTGEILWKQELNGDTLQYTEGVGQNLYLLYQEHGLQDQATVLTRISLSGEREDLWQGKPDMFQGIICAKQEGEQIVLSDQTGLWMLCLTERNCEQLILWKDFDYAESGNICAIDVTDSGQIQWVDAYQGRLRRFRLETEADLTGQDRVQVVLAGIGISADLQSAAARYNREQTTCQIEIIDYGEGGEISAQDALMRLQSDLAVGQPLDLIYMDGLDTDWLASKGYLANLYDCMELYGGMEKDDLVEEVRGLLEQEGGLYYLFPDFHLDSLLLQGNNPFENEGTQNNSYVLDVEPYAFLQSCLWVNRETWLPVSQQGYELRMDKLEELIRKCTEWISASGSRTGAAEEMTSQIRELAIENLYTIQAWRSVLGDDTVFMGYPVLSGGSASILAPNTDSQRE